MNGLPHYIFRIIAALFLAIWGAMSVRAQVTGIPPINDTTRTRRIPADTLFIFEPARPLIDSQYIAEEITDLLGLDLMFSASGFGIGGFYQMGLAQRLTGFVNIGITGSRSTDEFERWSPLDQDWRVPGKVNRLYTIPVMIGARYRILGAVLVDNFRPYVNAGVGPVMVMALPYEYEFFRSIGHTRAYFTGGAFVGVGAEVGGSRPVLGLNVRYFYIPLSPGVESIRGDAITDFGGLFLTLNIGFRR